MPISTAPSIRFFAILWAHRSVQHPVNSADLPPVVRDTHLVVKPSTSATSGDSPPDPALHKYSGNRGAISPPTASDPAPDLTSPGRHKVGPDSTWAVRQSAELEDLQAALDKQCFRRGRQAAAASPTAAVDTAAAAEEDVVPPQDLQDAPGPKYGDLGAGSVDNAVVVLCCLHALSPWSGCIMHETRLHCVTVQRFMK